MLFAIPNQFEDVKHCNVLSESISTGLRKLFSVIEYESLIKEVNYFFNYILFFTYKFLYHYYYYYFFLLEGCDTK